MDTDRLPRYAMYQRHRCRVLDYSGDGYFRILLTDDSTALVPRGRLVFCK